MPARNIRFITSSGFMPALMSGVAITPCSNIASE